MPVTLSDLLLTTLVRKRAGSFAGRLARRLALAAAHLFLFLFEAALDNRFDMLHSDLLISELQTKAANRLYNRCGLICNPIRVLS